MASLLSLLSRLVAALLITTLAPTAFADPPGRVGRLADLQGPVWLYDAETAEWVAAGRNRPLTTGDRVSTDGTARAELRIGSTTLRLDAGTEIELLQLDDEIVRVQVHNGSMALRLRTHEAAREFELVTAEGRFKPDRAGRYRLDRVDATSSITVWSGQLLFEARDNAVTLVAGQRADIWNNGRTQYTLTQPQRDAFADAVAASELVEERSVSAKYVSPEMTGVEDLDRHGRWEDDPEYGALWVPRAVAPDWAPYRFGHWAWVRPWGWTWVDDAAWGFAPFHYGRWVYLRNAWCWAPGRWVARPVYAPALVAWVGAPGLSVSVGVGPRVGWFPLAPREVFVPGYRSSPNYVRNVNVTHVTTITNVTQIINSPNAVVGQTNYINRGLPGAMTIVPASVVSGRLPVASSRVHLTDPRPGASGGRDVPALATVTAAPPIHAPRPRLGNGPAPVPPGVPIAGGNATAWPTRPDISPPGAPPAVAPPQARATVPPPPTTQPAIRVQRPAIDTAMQGPGAEPRARQVPPPVPAVPATPRPAIAGPTAALPVPAMPAAPAHPSLPAPPGARVTLPAAGPPATTPQPTPPGPAAAPPPRPQPPSPAVMAPRSPLPPSPPSPKAAPPVPAAAPAPTAQPAVAPVAVPGVVPVAPTPAPAPATRARPLGDEPRGAGKAEK